MEKYISNETIELLQTNLLSLLEQLQERRIVLPVAGIAALYFLFLKRVGFRGSPRKLKETSEHEPYDGEEVESFVKKSISVHGWLMTSIFRRITVSLFGKLVLRIIKSKFKVEMFRDLVLPEAPMFHPLVEPEHKTVYKDVHHSELEALIKESSKDGFHFQSISDLNAMYRKKLLTPVDVAKKIIVALKSCPQNIFVDYDEGLILTLAEESTRRWNSSNPLSVIDGVPVGVKDEFIVAGHTCRNGLPLDNTEKYLLDDEAGLVKKLRQNGALLIGVTNMHQIGMGVFGINPSRFLVVTFSRKKIIHKTLTLKIRHHGTTRNPYNLKHSTSGSSSGSAAAIASGLCTFALGTDGGGSIRLPAANCGIVGLKATYGRYSKAGMKANGNTVGHSGALCSSVRDMAIVYGLLAGVDDLDSLTHMQPSVDLGNIEEKNLKMKIGVDWALIDECVPEIRDQLTQAISQLESANNAEIISIHIPEKEEIYKAHILTILAEMANTNAALYEDHFDKINIDTLMNLTAAREISAHDYLQSARQRTRTINCMKYLFKNVDAIITPGFNVFQPMVTSSIEKYGLASNAIAGKLIQNHALGNLIGIPCICQPIGYSQDYLPISIQVMAPWWREDILFRISSALESHIQLRKPEQFYNYM